jgi:hypothetical protein
MYLVAICVCLGSCALCGLPSARLWFVPQRRGSIGIKGVWELGNCFCFLYDITDDIALECSKSYVVCASSPCSGMTLWPQCLKILLCPMVLVLITEPENIYGMNQVTDLLLFSSQLQYPYATIHPPAWRVDDWTQLQDRCGSTSSQSDSHMMKTAAFYCGLFIHTLLTSVSHNAGCPMSEVLLECYIGVSAM